MTNRKSREYLSTAELAAVLSYVRTRADYARRKGAARAVVDELIVILLAGAGLRPHELLAMRIRDLPETHGETTLWIRDANGGVARKVNIDEDLAELLARFVRFYRNGAHVEDLLLVSERGGPLNHISLYSKVRRIGREAGIGQLSPATLRRTYIHQLYKNEQDLRYVQEQTGYARRRSIAKYFKINSDGEDTRGECAGREETSADSKADDPVKTPTCEACGTILANARGERIESGQLLCDGCLRYFRRA